MDAGAPPSNGEMKMTLNTGSFQSSETEGVAGSREGPAVDDIPPVEPYFTR